uniref:PK_Tyr_Ser-Thr domain-containing protein n=1 Tax=Ascaris lumbricoides TaxID=6252 RepID=A0A0M3HTA8_ASCLU
MNVWFRSGTFGGVNMADSTDCRMYQDEESSCLTLSNIFFQPIQDVVRHIERGYRMEPPEGCPTEISRLMNEAWMLDPNSRPTFSHMLQRLKALQAVGFPPVANSS